MDIRSILGTAFPEMAANSSRFGNISKGFGSQNGLLETLVPLLGSRNPLINTMTILYQMLGKHTGLDPGMLLTVFGFLWAFNKLYRQVWHTAYGFISTYVMSDIHMNNTDEIYSHVMKWLATQPRMANSRSLMAETLSKTAWEDEDIDDSQATRISADGSGVYLNFSNQEARSPPRFIPALGTHGFWFQGNYFRLHRKQMQFLEDSSGDATFTSKEDLVISCFGRSPAPIKRLLQHAKEEFYTNRFARTTIKRPAAAGMRRYGGRNSWLPVAQRPVRPMRTVVLDPKQKVQLLADVNEYLMPSAAKWYANRGIPLRRGYLFFGPPGTGKTSLSFALAGVFGLDIHVISLLEPTLSEEDLIGLFNTLPRRCVVLLEDIDTAGLSRPGETKPEANDGSAAEKTGSKNAKSSSDQGSQAKHAGEPADWKVSDLARELKRQNHNDDRKGISLSGLLNAIDGVASHEGRVLIMTTNHPEALDDALIRPGRVDLQVAFTNATQEQARELFERMYEDDSRRIVATSIDSPTPAVSATSTSPAGGVSTSDEKTQASTANHSRPTTTTTTTRTLTDGTDKETTGITHEQLKTAAAEFADKIPDGQFSPAEIQGFLLKRKKHPLQALADSDKWVEAMVRLKASKTKLLDVQ